MIVVIDDEDRENEGDLTMAAELVTPEAINFMATHGRGLICLAMTGERLDELDLAAMVPDNTALHDTAFTVSIDLKGYGVTTGISAHDRARTIRAAVDARQLSGRLRPAGTRLPAARSPWRRPGAPGTDRGGRRSRRPRGPAPCGRDLRDRQRRRHDGSRAGSDPVLQDAWPRDDHRRGPGAVPVGVGVRRIALGDRWLFPVCLRPPALAARSNDERGKHDATQVFTIGTCLRRPGRDRPIVRSRPQRQPCALAEPGRLRPQGHRPRVPDARWHRGGRRRRAHLLDQHGRPQSERRLHRARRPRREESQDDRSPGRHVHAETAPARQAERQAVLVGPRRDARHARKPRRVGSRNSRGDGPGRRRSPRPDEVVRRHRRRCRARTHLLDAKRPGRRGIGPHLSGEYRNPEG